MAFYGSGSWSFGNEFARNVVTFGVGNSLSSHTENCKNNFLVLVKERLMILIATFVKQRKSLVLALVKQRQNFASVSFTMIIMVVCLFIGKQSISLTLIIKISTFQLSFVWEAHLVNLMLLILEKYLERKCV